MRKLILFFAAALVLQAFNSCKDYAQEDEDIDTPAKSDVNYLVMFYGQGGGNLDPYIVSNIVQAIDEGGSDKVGMTFEYKLSKPTMQNQALDNFDGTRRFTIDENAHLKGMFKSMSKEYPNLDETSFDYYLKNIKSERIGNAYYDMSNSDSLAAFIAWSKKKYPNAKRTILIISDHGSGWDLSDGKAEMEAQNKSRGILFDDNLDDKSLKAIDVANGIKKGGGVDLYYTDACLMSMYENIYTYAKAVRYLLTAVEVTPGAGGDYRKLLNVLKTSGTLDSDLEDAMHKYADYCVSEQWWGKKHEGGYVGYSDIGLYDLSKIDAVTPLLQKIAHTMAEKFVSDESIGPTLPTGEIPALSDKFAPYIRKAVTGCLVSYINEIFKLSSLPQTLVPYLRKDMPVIKDEESNIEYIESHYVIDWIKYAPTENAKEAYEAHRKDWDALRQKIINSTHITYSMTDLLHQIDLELRNVGAQNNPFGQLHDDLVSAIRSVAYIACTKPVNILDVDQAYDYCSPGIFILPLNEAYNTPDNPYHSSKIKCDEASRFYQATEFDKAVGWSNFLKVIDVIPSVLHNPARHNKK